VVVRAVNSIARSLRCSSPSQSRLKHPRGFASHSYRVGAVGFEPATPDFAELAPLEETGSKGSFHSEIAHMALAVTRV
jgi:hypothetical protein